MEGMEHLIPYAPWVIAFVAFTVAMAKGAHWAGGVTNELHDLRQDVAYLSRDHEVVEDKLANLAKGQARMEASLDHLHKCVHRLDNRLDRFEAGRGQAGLGDAGPGMARRGMARQGGKE